MKTKRILMAIELALIFLGICGAIFFTNFSSLSQKNNDLFCNVSIGILTGGLVALLIEIPMFAADRTTNKNVLRRNSYYAAMRLKQLIQSIDDACAHPQKEITENFCSRLLQNTVDFLFPLLNMDRAIYLCRTKKKQLELFIDQVHTFFMLRESFDLEFKIAINTIERDVNSSGNFRQIEAREVITELKEIRHKSVQMVGEIEKTMNLVLNKKELKEWNRYLQEKTDVMIAAFQRECN